MDTIIPTITEETADSRLQGIHTSLGKLERRDWWLWMLAVVVMLLLTVAVVSLTFPGLLLHIEDPFFQYGINQAVRGLVGLVLIFNTYTIYQQVLIKRLRRELSRQLNVMTELQARAQEFYRQANVDPLTGLYNRRFGEQRLAAEAARSQRYGHPLAAVMLDLNEFKAINDRYGHPAGDAVLREFAARLNAAIRISDSAVRIGGDEFLVLLPECPVEQVRSLLARLRPMEVQYHGEKIPVKFSAGSVGYDAHETPEQFLERADQSLYADKRVRKAHAAELPAAR